MDVSFQLKMLINRCLFILDKENETRNEIQLRMTRLIGENV